MRQSLSTQLAAIDASADASGKAIRASLLFRCSAQAVTTGTSTGTMKLQYSNDIVNPTEVDPVPTNWSDVPSATVAIAGAGTYSIPLTELCYEYVRVVFVHTNAAAGMLTANFKSLGQ